MTITHNYNIQSHIGGEGFREQWHEEEEEEEEKGEGGEKESVTVDVIVGLSGGILLLVVALVTIKILHYRRTKRLVTPPLYLYTCVSLPLDLLTSLDCHL